MRMMLGRILFEVRMKARWWIIVGCVFLLCGCSVQKDSMEKIRDVEFTVMDEQKIPKELAMHIAEVKKEPFEIAYGDEGYLYIAKGYGEKELSGYSIEVEQCFETENVICVETNLLGPQKGEDVLEEETCPYIVIKTEYSEKSIVFQ